MARIELPDGAWAEVRDDIRSAPRRLVKAMEEADTAMAMAMPSALAAAMAGVKVDASTLPADEMAQAAPLITRKQELTIVALVSAWSFDLPVSVESLGEIPQGAYEALAAAADKTTPPAATTLADLADPTPALADSSA